MTLARACRDEVEAGFGYPSGGEVRERRVEPYRLVASDRRWYLLAYDLDRDDWRSFRVDRMTGVSAPDLALPPARGARRGDVRAGERGEPGLPAPGALPRARVGDAVRAQIPASAAVVREREASSARCSAAPETSTPCSCTCSCWGMTSRCSTLRSSEGAAACWPKDCCRPVRRPHRHRPRRGPEPRTPVPSAWWPSRMGGQTVREADRREAMAGIPQAFSSAREAPCSLLTSWYGSLTRS